MATTEVAGLMKFKDEVGNVFILYPVTTKANVKDLDLQKDIEAALEQAKESGQFDGPQGPQGEKGDQGEQGIQGEKGETGADGVNATINGMNTLVMQAGQGITITQEEGSLTIASNTIISQTDITAGTTALATGQSYHVYD